MRRSFAGGIGVVVATAAMPLSALAAPSPSPDASGRSIAVSVPADPVPLTPGQTGRVMIRVVDPAPTPVTVTVTGMGISLGDNGQVSFTGAADATWASHADFPSGDLTVPAMSFVDVFITVRMPAVISPDLYYIGFVVRPVATEAGVKVINEIGGFFTVDVPGPRVRSLSAELSVPGFNVGPIHIGGLIVGDHVLGQLTVHNAGGAAVRFWGENDVTTWTASPTQQRIAKSLVPITRSRSFAINGDPGLFVDVVNLSVTVSYPDNTETSTKEIVLTKTMLVVSPWALLSVCGLIALFVGWRLRKRMRRSTERWSFAGAGRPRGST